MTAASSAFDPYANDPLRWGVSLAQMRELMLACLDAVPARTVAEVGAFAGDLTRVLVEWAERTGARVQAIDPSPQDGLLALAEASERLELIRETSLAALPRLPLPDAMIIDGDHNYHTVSQELKLLAQRAAGGPLPLLLFHDVCWPHARRDDYFAPDALPAEARHPMVGDGGGISPEDPGIVPYGLPFPRSAAHEGGPRNGVLTAIEDFAAAHAELRLTVVPAFFGFGALWERAQPYAGELARILDPWDRHPVLERLEANRVQLLAHGYAEVSELRERLARQEDILRRLLDSRAFSIADRLSWLRVKAGLAREAAPISKDELHRALER